MTGCPGRPELSRILSGDPTVADGEAVERHLEGCASCQAIVEELLAAATPDWAVLHHTDLKTVVGLSVLNQWLETPPPPTWAGLPWNPLLPADRDAGSRPLAEQAPRKIPGYELLGELGRGGMGVVFKARQLRLNRVVALKMILAGELASPELATRFLAEAEAIARLQHPNIVQIYHTDEHAGHPYFEMEYVAGGSLADRLDGTPRAPVETARFLATVARAVAEAHRLAIVHRDLKPANILIGSDGSPKVADFGLAKSMDDTSGLTRTDSIVGSPSYMAPEQAAGKGGEIGPSADVYSLGAILYEQLTGRPPFRGATVLDTLQLVKLTEPIPPSRLVPGLPRDIETICLKCLEKSPPRRYPTAADLAEDLDRFAASLPIVARPVSPLERVWKAARRRPAIAALALGLALAFGALLTLGAVSYDQINRALSQTRIDRKRALDARTRAEVARSAALAETYRATLSEVRALRAGHLPGWRDDALNLLRQLAATPSARHDPATLRTEAVACLGGDDVREVARLSVFGEWLWAIDFSPDGRTLASAHTDGTIHLWDVEARTHRAEVADPKYRAPARPSVNGGRQWPCIRYRPDGRELAYTSRDHRVVFLDPSGTRTVRPPILDPAAQPCGLARDRRGRLAVGWDASRVDLIDDDNRTTRSFSDVDPTVFALSPDGHWIALSRRDHSILLRKTDSDEPGIVLNKHREMITDLAFSPDGQTLASSSWDHTAILWDVARREERLTLRGHKEIVTAIAYSPDGAWVATSGDDFTTRLWETRDGQPLAVLPGVTFMKDVAFSPDSRHLAAAANNNVIFLYQLTSRRERKRLAGHVRGVQCLAFHPRDERLATGADDQSVIFWDPGKGRMLDRWVPHPQSFLGRLAYSPDGNLLATACFAGAEPRPPMKVRIWDTRTGSLRANLADIDRVVGSLAFTPDGRRLATGDERGTIRISDVATGRTLRRESIGDAPVRSLAFLEGGRRVVAAGADGRLVDFGPEGAGPPRVVNLPGSISRFRVDDRRDHLVVGGAQGSLSAIRLSDLAVDRTLENAHQGGIDALALSPDGGLLVTGGADHRVVLRDAATFEPLLTFPAWTGAIRDVSFNGAGTRLAFGGVDSDVAVWDLGLLREGLAAVGLAWDRPPPTSDPAPNPPLAQP